MPNQNVNAFESLSVPKALSKFIVPAVVSQLATLILNLTDAFFVGRTGDEFQIGAMTITLPLILLMSVIATIFGAGGNANIAASLGVKNPERAKKFSCFAVYSSIVIVAIVSFAIFAFEDVLLGVLGANADSLEYCRGYIRWTLHVACVPMVFSQVMAQMFTAEGETRIASIGITGAGIINIILDPIFIFPLGMGIEGAGLATCIANYCSAIFFLVCYFKKRKTTVIDLNVKHYTVKEGICKQVIAIGLPAGLSIFLMNCVDFVRNYLLSVCGTQSDFAAWGVVQRLGNAFLQIALGIAMGVRPLISYNYTAGLGKRTKSLIAGSCIVMGCYTVFCFAFTQLFPEPLVNMFLPIPELMPRAIGFLRIYIFCIFAIGFLELFSAIFQSFGDWKTAIAGAFVGKIVIMIPALFILSKLWTVNGVVAAQPVGDTMAVVFYVVMFVRFMKKNQEKFS